MMIKSVTFYMYDFANNKMLVILRTYNYTDSFFLNIAA